MKKENNIQPKHQHERLITRKMAIQKASITALTAASIIFLSTKAHAQGSPNLPTKPPTW